MARLTMEVEIPDDITTGVDIGREVMALGAQISGRARAFSGGGHDVAYEPDEPVAMVDDQGTQIGRWTVAGPSPTFSLTIRTGNAEFHDADGEPDDFSRARGISRILLDVSQRLANGHTEGRCRDINGNTVGQWMITAEQEAAVES